MNKITYEITNSAKKDIVKALVNSKNKFGINALKRYRALIDQAIKDICDNPRRYGSKQMEELGEAIWSYHLFYSRQNASIRYSIVKKPRHILFFTLPNQNTLLILRLLHDSMNLSKYRLKEHLEEA